MALAPGGNRAACREGYSISIVMGTVQGEPTAQALWVGRTHQARGRVCRPGLAESQPQPRALGLALAPLPPSGQLQGCWGWEC